MSMLAAQTEKLRKTAYEVERIKNDTIGMLDRDSIILADAAMQLREAADTITDLRKTLRRESDARMELQRDYNNQCERIRNQRKNLKEMQAALERKTCRMTLCAAGNDYARYRCSECEQETMTPRVLVEGISCGYERPTYCVNCGREVIE